PPGGLPGLSGPRELPGPQGDPQARAGQSLRVHVSARRAPERHRLISAGDPPAQDDGRGGLRAPGSPGVGSGPLPGPGQSRLPGIHRGACPQHPQSSDQTTILGAGSGSPAAYLTLSRYLFVPSPDPLLQPASPTLTRLLALSSRPFFNGSSAPACTSPAATCRRWSTGSRGRSITPRCATSRAAGRPPR